MHSVDNEYNLTLLYFTYYKIQKNFLINENVQIGNYIKPGLFEELQISFNVLKI